MLRDAGREPSGLAGGGKPAEHAASGFGDGPQLGVLDGVRLGQLGQGGLGVGREREHDFAGSGVAGLREQERLSGLARSGESAVVEGQGLGSQGGDQGLAGRVQRNPGDGAALDGEGEDGGAVETGGGGGGHGSVP